MSVKEETIRLKIEKSKSLLNEVDVLMQHKFYVTTISRLYYSCYHATKALLLTKDIITQTHRGAIAMLNLHFVQSGLFDSSHAIFFGKLMKERIEDDYGDFMILEENEVSIFIEPAKSYVAYVCELVEKYFSESDGIGIFDTTSL